MDREIRERIIHLGAQISGARTAIAELRARLKEAESQLAQTEAELDRLIGNNRPTTLVGGPPVSSTAVISAQVGQATGIRLPVCAGTLNDQVVALLRANPNRPFAAEEVFVCLNKMPGRTEPAQRDSVYAALSRVVSDGQVSRLERGTYASTQG
jgi:uncharacterized coiled-coil protein SlyX